MAFEKRSVIYIVLMIGKTVPSGRSGNATKHTMQSDCNRANSSFPVWQQSIGLNIWVLSGAGIVLLSFWLSTWLNCFLSLKECSRVLELHTVNKSKKKLRHLSHALSSTSSQDQTLGDVTPKNQPAIHLNVRHMSQNLRSQCTLKINVKQIPFFHYHNNREDSKLKNSTQACFRSKDQDLLFRAFTVFIKHRPYENCKSPGLNSRSLDLKQRLIKAGLACALLTINEMCLSSRSLLSIIPRSTVSFF